MVIPQQKRSIQDSDFIQQDKSMSCGEILQSWTGLIAIVLRNKHVHARVETRPKLVWGSFAGADIQDLTVLADPQTVERDPAIVQLGMVCPTSPLPTS